MQIQRSGAKPSGQGPTDYFTGTGRIDPMFSPPDPARVSGALVTFDPVPAPPGTPIRSARP